MVFSYCTVVRQLAMYGVYRIDFMRIHHLATDNVQLQSYSNDIDNSGIEDNGHDTKDHLLSFSFLLEDCS